MGFAWLVPVVYGPVVRAMVNANIKIQEPGRTCEWCGGRSIFVERCESCGGPRTSMRIR